MCQTGFQWKALYFKLNAGVWILLDTVYATHDTEVWKTFEEELKGSEFNGNRQDGTNSKKFSSCLDFAV